MLVVLQKRAKVVEKMVEVENMFLNPDEKIGLQRHNGCRAADVPSVMTMMVVIQLTNKPSPFSSFSSSFC